jgi:branched-chain amino acid transport system ATP-binding protein
MTDVLKVERLSAAYGHFNVLHDVSFSVPTGAVVALLGANGAGKTSTLRALCGMLTTQGRIELDGQRIDGFRPDRIARCGVAHVPDGRGTFLELTVQENLRLGAYLRHDDGVQRHTEILLTYFPKLKARIRQQAGTLSGGEQQMLAIARALLLKPKLLLLDEPSFGLAPVVVQEIYQIMRRINAEQSVSILLVEQNANLALGIASHAYLLETGRIVLSGHSDAIRADETVRRSYLGHRGH